MFQTISRRVTHNTEEFKNEYLYSLHAHRVLPLKRKLLIQSGTKVTLNFDV